MCPDDRPATPLTSLTGVMERPRFPRTRLRSAGLALVVGLSCLPLVAPGHAAAQSIEDIQRRVTSLADELDRLEVQMSNLDEQHIEALNRQEELDAEIADIESDVAEAEAELGEMRGTLYTAAVNQFMHGGRNSTLTNLLASVGGVQDALTRSEIINIALNQGSITTDSLDASATELAKKKSKLEKQRRNAESAAAYALERQDNAEQLYAKYQRLLTSVEGDLQEALRAERQRRGRSISPPSKEDTSKYKNIPGVSAKAALAVRRGLELQGVPYSARRPINVSYGLDCSGFTYTAWQAAGVSIPRSSRAQYAGLPKIPKSEAKAGDLIFYHSPISHVSLYIGGGREVHSPQRGDVVRVRSTDWSRVVGVARPG